MLSPVAVSWPPASMPPWLPRCHRQPLFLVLFFPSPGPPGSPWRSLGRGGMATVTAPRSFSLVLGPSGQEGEAEASLLPCCLLCSATLGRDFPKQGSPEGFLVCFAVKDTLSSTEGRDQQQCHTLPQPLLGSVVLAARGLGGGSVPEKRAVGHICSHLGRVQPPRELASVPHSLPCRSGQRDGSRQPLRKGLQPPDGQPGAWAGAANGDGLRAPCHRALLCLH